MAMFDIEIYGSECLRRKCRTVEELDPDLEDFIDRMVETMIVGSGVGLAASQVGVCKRVAVMNPEPDREKTLIRMINPKIVALSNEEDTIEEGCLSVPGIRGRIIRPSALEVVYIDRKGRERRLEAEGLLARIIQHEVDHLNGILFIDHLSIAKRALLRRKLKDLESGRG